MKCLKCEKDLTVVDGTVSNVSGGGDLHVRFHYGSRHDMMIGFNPDPGLQGFICDDCFDHHRHLFVRIGHGQVAS